MKPFEGLIQEIGNSAQMTWVQYWRQNKDLFSEDEDKLRNLWLAAFHYGATISIDLACLGFEQVRKDATEG